MPASGPGRRLFSLFGRRTDPARGQYELVENTLSSAVPAAPHNLAEDDSRLRKGRGAPRRSESDKDASKSEGLTAVGGHKRNPRVCNNKEPTESEKQRLRRVADNLPWPAFLVAIVELSERFAYYGMCSPFQNYMQYSYNDPSGLPGAIGLGQQGATGLANLFQSFSYFTPIIGALVADQYLGRYRTICYFAVIYIAGLVILVMTSMPVSIRNGLALPGLVVAMIVIGLGTGGIKSNVSPLIAEQYRNDKPYIRTLASGERVIVDPAVTVQRIYMIFYLCINFGSLSPIATTYMERDIGFWSGFLLCLFMFLIGFATLLLGKNQYVLHPPKGSVIPQAFRICWIALKSRGNLDAAKPGYQRKSGLHSVPWDSRFVDEVGRALTACKVFLFYPIYWAVYGQMVNNFVSQAGVMQTHGIPNDVIQIIDPLAIIIFIPVCDRIFYPFLRRIEIPFKPITRIFMGFMLGALAMAYAACVQKLIYTSGPCYDAPGACDAALREDSTHAPNEVHIAVQIPAYILIGLSEILASVTGLEYAFTKAPPSMKSFIMSLFLLTTAVGAAFGALLSPVAADPYLAWMYTGLATACLAAGLAFWFFFRGLNDAEDSMNELELDEDEVGSADESAVLVGSARKSSEHDETGDAGLSLRM